MNRTERNNNSFQNNIDTWVINSYRFRRTGPLSNSVKAEKQMPCDMYLETESRQLVKSSLCINGNDRKALI